jgi:hypothetical protein
LLADDRSTALRRPGVGKDFAAINLDGLTYSQALKKFGVAEVAIWKRRRGDKPTRELGASRDSAGGSLASMIRADAQARVHELIPSIIREEIA